MEKTQTAKKLPKLTRKQRGFVNSYVKDENGTQAVLEHYDIESSKPEKVASVIAVENLAKPSIIEAIEVKRKSLRQALIDKGITEDYLAEKVQVLLTGVDKEGNVDYTAIDKGLKHAETWYGVEDPNKPKGNTTYNFILNQSFKDKIKPLEDELKTQFRNAKPIEES